MLIVQFSDASLQLCKLVSDVLKGPQYIPSNSTDAIIENLKTRSSASLSLLLGC